MFIRRIYDFIDLKGSAYFNSEPSFFLQFPSCCFGDALKRTDLASRNNPRASLRILIPLSEEDSVASVSNQQGRADSWECVTHWSPLSLGQARERDSIELSASRESVMDEILREKVKYLWV